MIRRNAFFIIGCWMIAAGPVLAQEVPCEKYKLPNGMTVILHVDHHLPLASINIWYHVGSKDEPVHRSGFAHLFEHLMFMGTRRVPNGEFDTIMESGGGSNNASTSNDRTNYFSSGPASLLPTLLWLDADRLEDLGRTMDKAKLDKQRDVVRNERRQSYENRPYGKAELQIEELMYPVGHPYHIPVIGTHEDLEAATVGDVKDFFANYYVPNNASLVVAGDFDPAAIKPMIAKLFGSLPRGQDPVHHTAAPVHLDRVIRATMLDAVQLPLIAVAYNSPAKFAEGDAEMDLAGNVLSEGKTSRLYKRLVYDDKTAVSVSAYQDSGQLGSTFRIDVMAKPDSNLEQIERAVDEEVARFVKDGPTADELERRKAGIEMQMLHRLQRIEARADILNEYEYFFGDPNWFKRDLDRYRKATTSGVQKWAANVLTRNARLIMRVMPEAPPPAASGRDKRPDAMTMAPFSPAAPETFKLANGLPVMLWSRKDLPLVAMQLMIHPGRALEEPTRAGQASLIAEMLDEGAGDLDSLHFSDALQSLGAQFGSRADHESFHMTLSVLKRNFQKAAGLVADAVRRPRFDPREWDRVKHLHLEELKSQDDEPTIVAARVAARSLFGEQHPYGWPVDGTPQSVEALKLDDIRSAHTALFNPKSTTLLIAGDLTTAEAQPILEKLFGDWTATGSPGPEAGDHPFPAPQGLKVVLVDRPMAVQTVIQFVMPGPKFADANRVQYRLLNTLLGGSFTSRLVQNLREKHGYTYGARSRFVMQPGLGYFVASSSVRTDVTGKSLTEFMAEFKRLRGGDVSDAEAAKACETLRTNVVDSFAGLEGLLSEAAELRQADMPFETLGKDMTSLTGIHAGELNKLAASAIPLDHCVLVLVGDKKAILPQLTGLDLPTPTELNVRGEPMKSK